MNSQRTAIITGGGSGIGAACAKLLADQGWRVMINGRTESKLRLVTQGNANIDHFVSDISQGDSAERLVNFTWGHFGRIDVLIHAAGVLVDDLPVTEMTHQQWSEVTQINITSTFLICQAVSEIMQKHQHAGTVIIVSSLAGLWQYMLPGRIAYNAANAAKVAMAVTYRLEMKSLTGCQASAVCFGLVDTPMTKDFLETHPQYRQQALSPSEAADGIYQLIQNPPACPVVTITKLGGIREATTLVWQPAPSIE